MNIPYRLLFALPGSARHNCAIRTGQVSECERLRNSKYSDSTPISSDSPYSHLNELGVPRRKCPGGALSKHLQTEFSKFFQTNRIFTRNRRRGKRRLREALVNAYELLILSPASKSSAISRNYSKAAWRSSTISTAMTPGSGRFSESSRDSSLSQKISRLALSRLTSSS